MCLTRNNVLCTPTIITYTHNSLICTYKKHNIATLLSDPTAKSSSRVSSSILFLWRLTSDHASLARRKNPATALAAGLAPKWLFSNVAMAACYCIVWDKMSWARLPICGMQFTIPYIYTLYMHKHIHIYIFFFCSLSVYIYIYVYIFVYSNIVYIWTYVYIYVHVYIYICIYLCKCPVCMYKSYIYIHLYGWLSTSHDRTGSP